MAAIGVDAAAARARSRRARQQAMALRRASRAQQLRTDELADRLAQTLGSRALPLGNRGDSFVLELARLRPMVRLARNSLRRWLEERGIPADTVSEIALACSEACANAVEHPSRATRQRIVVEAHSDGRELEPRVRDFGVWSLHQDSDQRGRGLSMIDSLMDSVDVRQTASGTEIVMRRSVQNQP